MLAYQTGKDCDRLGGKDRSQTGSLLEYYRKNIYNIYCLSQFHFPCETFVNQPDCTESASIPICVFRFSPPLYLSQIEYIVPRPPRVKTKAACSLHSVSECASICAKIHLVLQLTAYKNLEAFRGVPLHPIHKKRVYY